MFNQQRVLIVYREETYQLCVRYELLLNKNRFIAVPKLVLETCRRPSLKPSMKPHMEKPFNVVSVQKWVRIKWPVIGYEHIDITLM